MHLRPSSQGGASLSATCAVQGPVAEQVLLLENVGTSVQVGPTQLPSLHKLLVQAASTLQLAGNCPDLYVRQSPTPNAYTLAIAGRKPFVVCCSLQAGHASSCAELTPPCCRWCTQRCWSCWSRWKCRRAPSTLLCACQRSGAQQSC